jgi:hypothetical protein
MGYDMSRRAIGDLAAPPPISKPIFRVWNATGKPLSWVIYSDSHKLTQLHHVITLPASWTATVIDGYTNLQVHPPKHLVKIGDMQWVIVDQIRVRTDWPF